MEERTIRKKIREMLEKYPEIVIDEILENGFQWPAELETEKPYFIRHDDDDGNIQGFQISFSSKGSRTGDSYINPIITEFTFVEPPVFGAYCFRMPLIGGSRAPQMNMALRILALAIVKYSENYYFEKGEKKKKEK